MPSYRYRSVVTLYNELTDNVEVEVTVYDDNPMAAVERASHATLHSIPKELLPPEINGVDDEPDNEVTSVRPRFATPEDIRGAGF